MSSISESDATYKLTNNLSRVLLELARDFEKRALEKAHERGHTQIRRSHSSLFSNLGFQSVRLTELAERAGITQQAMGKLVKEMEEVGYVRRSIDESDKRAKIIELTELGKHLVNDSMEIVDEILEEYRLAMGREGIEDLDTALRNSITALKSKTAATATDLPSIYDVD